MNSVLKNGGGKGSGVNSNVPCLEFHEEEGLG